MLAGVTPDAVGNPDRAAPAACGKPAAGPARPAKRMFAKGEEAGLTEGCPPIHFRPADNGGREFGRESGLRT